MKAKFSILGFIILEMIGRAHLLML